MSIEVLSTLRTDELRFSHEARPARFIGPQKACHAHELEISMMERGGEAVRIGRRDFDLVRFEYTLIGPGMEHSSRTTASAAVEMNVHLSQETIERAADDLGIRLHRDWPIGPFTAPRELVEIALAVRREAAYPELGTAPMVNALGYYLAGLLLRRHFGARERVEADRLDRAVELMRARLAEPLTVDEMAAASGLSRFRFIHAFKAKFGLPPYAYLTRLRLECAAERMRSTDLSLTEIAFECGFGSSARFSDAFKRAFGVAPSRWRSES